MGYTIILRGKRKDGVEISACVQFSSKYLFKHTHMDINYTKLFPELKSWNSRMHVSSGNVPIDAKIRKNRDKNSLRKYVATRLPTDLSILSQ